MVASRMLAGNFNGMAEQGSRRMKTGKSWGCLSGLAFLRCRAQEPKPKPWG